MNMKKQYIAPATEVLDMEVQLMIQGVSGGESMSGDNAVTWSEDNNDAVSASEAW